MVRSLATYSFCSVFVFLITLTSVDAATDRGLITCNHLSNIPTTDEATIDQADLLSRIGSKCFADGRFEVAANTFWRALKISQSIYGPRTKESAVASNNFGAALMELGDLKDAEIILRNALRIIEEVLGPDDLETINIVNTMASLAQKLGDFGAAEVFQRRAIVGMKKNLGQRDLLTAVALDNLGGILKARGSFGEAEIVAREANEIFAEVSGQNSDYYFTSLNNIAALLQKNGNYYAAQRMFSEALKGRERLLGAKHPKTAEVMVNLCELLREKHEFSDAEKCFRRSLEIYADWSGLGDMKAGQSLIGVGRALVGTGNFSAALPFFRKATSVGITERTDFLVALRAVNQSDAAESFEVMQRVQHSKVGTAVNQIAARLSSSTGTLAETIRLEQDLTKRQEGLGRAALERMSRSKGAKETEFDKEIQEQLREIENQLLRVQNKIRSEFPEYADLLYPEPLSVLEVQSMLSEDEAVVAFNVGASHSYAWVIAKSKASWAELGATEHEINEQVKKVRASVAAQKSDTASLAHELFKMSFGPISHNIAGKKRISVVANGALTSLPLGMLVTKSPIGVSPKEVDWLLKSHAVTVLPSVYSLKPLRTQANRSKPSRRMIAFADPVFSKSARATAKSKHWSMRSLPSFYNDTQIDIASLAERLPQLEGTRVEVEAIAKNLSVESADIKMGLDATEAAVKQAILDQYEIVYFATHGLVAGELEEFSLAKAEPALALTIPDNPTVADDGLLQASEVAELKLNAEWVVLSACNTASSDGVGAEPLSGLAQAFFYAGGRSLLVSHWAVDDEATATLMSTLFAMSKDRPELSHGELLREASLQMLQSAQTSEKAHPRLWAPFVVVGEPVRGSYR